MVQHGWSQQARSWCEASCLLKVRRLFLTGYPWQSYQTHGNSQALSGPLPDKGDDERVEDPGLTGMSGDPL